MNLIAKDASFIKKDLLTQYKSLDSFVKIKKHYTLTDGRNYLEKEVHSRNGKVVEKKEFSKGLLIVQYEKNIKTNQCFKLLCGAVERKKATIEEYDDFNEFSRVEFITKQIHADKGIFYSEKVIYGPLCDYKLIVKIISNITKTVEYKKNVETKKCWKTVNSNTIEITLSEFEKIGIKNKYFA